MKLTNNLRDAFVRAVMEDVPAIDYDTQIRDLAMKKAVDRLPKTVQAVWKNKDTREFVQTGRFYTNYKHIDGVPGLCDWGKWIGEEPPKEWFADLEELSKLEDAQNEARSVLNDKIRAVAYSCTTRKALLEKLPEFEKYLPAEEIKASNLPAIANLVTDLIKAGWPDGGKKKVERETAEA